MTCDEFKEFVGAYALGALDERERVECDRHLALAEHQGCKEAHLAAQVNVDALASSLVPERPPAELWSRVAAALEGPAARAPARWRRAAMAVCAVAAVIVFVLAVLGQKLAGELARARGAAEQANAALQQKDALRRACESDLALARGELRLRQEAVAMLMQPATRVVALMPKAGAKKDADAVAVVNLSTKHALLVYKNMPPPGDKDYELWVIRGDQKRAAGLLRAGDKGSAIAELDAALLAGGADAFAITLEPKGGGPAPRGPIMMVGAMPKS